MSPEIPLEYSNYELLFAKAILEKIGVRWITQEWVSVEINGKRKLYKLDVFIPKGFYYEMKAKEGIVFEIQGEFHEKRGTIKKDERKKEDLEKAGYHVYEVWHDELKDLETLKEKIIGILKEEGVIK
jgi:G:T-mismatch repair DNA endonuclease (very short patch repair protein)